MKVFVCKNIFSSHYLSRCIKIFFISKLPSTPSTIQESIEHTQTTKNNTQNLEYQESQQHFVSLKNEETDNQHSSAPRIQIKNNSTNLNSPSKKQLAKNIERQILTTLSDLYIDKILNENDLLSLDKKIEISYTPTCQKNKGSFHAVIEKTSNKANFKAIKLLISTCPPLPNIHQIQSHLNYLMLHEIGHYLSFFKDRKRTNFNTICRTSGKSICDNKDFPSSYAQTHQEEDYAESFAYRYQEKKLGSQKEKEF